MALARARRAVLAPLARVAAALSLITLALVALALPVTRAQYTGIRVDAALGAVHALTGVSGPARPANTLVTHTLAVGGAAAQLAVVTVTQEVGAVAVLATDHLVVVVSLIADALAAVARALAATDLGVVVNAARGVVHFPRP